MTAPHQVPAPAASDIGPPQAALGNGSVLAPIRRHAAWLLLAFLFAISVFALRSLVDRLDSVRMASDVRQWAMASGSIGLFIHELQRERGMSSGFIASGGRSFDNQIRDQYARTDRSLAAMRPQLAELLFLDAGRRQVDDALGEIASLRHQVRQLEISREFAVDRYTEIIKQLFDLELDTFGGETESPLFRQQMALFTLMQAKETNGQERALISAMLSDRNFSAGRMALLQSIAAVEDARLAYFARLAAPVVLATFRGIQEDSATSQIQRIRQKVWAAGLYVAAGGKIGITHLPVPEEWFALSSRRIDAMKSLEDELSHGILDSAARREGRAQVELIANALLALLAGVLAIVLIYQIQRGRRVAEQQLSLAESVFANSVESILVTDSEARIVEVNPAFERMTGYQRAEAIGQTLHILRSERQDPDFNDAMWQHLVREGVWTGEIWNRRKSGEIFPALMSIAAVRDAKGRVANYTGMIFDLSQHKMVAKLIDELRTFDGLTGLPNRESWLSALDQAVVDGQRRGIRFAVLEVDLDRFKLINDSLGHSIGDKVLVEVAERLKTALRRHDVVARPSGNRFSVLLSEVRNPQDVGIICEKLLSVFSCPFELDGVCTHLTASIGATLFPDDGNDSKALMMAAESALYSAKADGRNMYKYYSREMNELGSQLFKLERMLRTALDREEFSVVYQPQVSADDGRLVGVEALLRWNNPELGNISPVQFIPVAEETGLIVPIGEWVMRVACRQARAWREEFGCELPVAVNLSARQFRRNDLLAAVQQILDETGLPPHLLELEITEGLLMSDPIGAIDLIRGLNFAGIKTALDDFGTGYSSLAYLKTFPLNRLKIDRAFVRDLPENDSDRAIANTVITLGLSLNMEVLAEGVETRSQAEFLKASGCQVFQGYLFGKPQPADELSGRIRRGELVPARRSDRGEAVSAS